MNLNLKLYYCFKYFLNAKKVMKKCPKINVSCLDTHRKLNFLFFLLVELGSHRNHICDEAKFGTLLISDKICRFQNVRKYRLQIVTFDGQQPISSMFLKKKIWKFHNFFLNICRKCSQNINKLYSFFYCQKNHSKKPLFKPISPLKARNRCCHSWDWSPKIRKCTKKLVWSNGVP